MPRLFEFGARQVENLAVSKQWVGDRHFVGAAPYSHQNHGVGVGENQGQRMREWSIVIARKSGRAHSALSPNSTAKAASRLSSGRVDPIDQVAPAHRADIGVACVLNAQPEQARKPGFAGNDRIAGPLDNGSACIHSGGGHQGEVRVR